MWSNCSTPKKTSLVAQLVKNLPAMWETWVQSLGGGTSYPLQYSSLENSMDCIVHGVAESQTRLERFSLSLSNVSGGMSRSINGNPLQCSCLENPRDGGAWWAAVYGVAQSRTRLKRLSSSSSSKKHKNAGLEEFIVVIRKEKVGKRINS